MAVSMIVSPQVPHRGCGPGKGRHRTSDRNDRAFRNGSQNADLQETGDSRRSTVCAIPLRDPAPSQVAHGECQLRR